MCTLPQWHGETKASRKHHRGLAKRHGTATSPFEIFRCEPDGELASEEYRRITNFVHENGSCKGKKACDVRGFSIF